MFGTILMGITAFMALYALWRTGGIPYLSRFSWKFRLLAGIGIWLLIRLGRTYGHNNSGTLPHLVELVSMDLLVIVFLAFASLLFVDLLTGFGLFLPRLAPRLRGYALIAGLALSGLAIIQGTRAPVVETYEVTMPGLPAAADGLELVALSDLHVGSLIGKDWLEARIEQVMDLQPDAVLLLGDFFDGYFIDYDGLLPVMRKLRAPLGVYAVEGNHEYYGRASQPLQLLQEAGYTVLLNTWKEPVPGLIFAGVRDLTIGMRTGRGEQDLEATLKNRPKGATVLLSHTPLLVEKAASQNVGLMLSGHTHAGQVWPFGYVVRLRFPYFEGRYQADDTTIIVSRGAGTWGPRMRLWEPGNILKITLRSK